MPQSSEPTCCWHTLGPWNSFRAVSRLFGLSTTCLPFPNDVWLRHAWHLSASTVVSDGFTRGSPLPVQKQKPVDRCFATEVLWQHVEEVARGICTATMQGDLAGRGARLLLALPNLKQVARAADWASNTETHRDTETSCLRRSVSAISSCLQGPM